LRELLKIEAIRNSPFLRSFLDLDKYYDDMNKLLAEPDENPNRSTMSKSDRSFLNTIEGNKKDNSNLIVNMEDSPHEQTLNYDAQGNSVNDQQYFLRK